MKRIFLVLALAASLQVANAQNNQVKSIPAATSALEKAAAATENPKQSTKVTTWLKYGQALIDAYAAPVGNVWLGMSQQDAAFLGGGEKPSAEEQVTVGGQALLKQVFASKNFYFNQAGQLAIIEVTKPIGENLLAKAVEAFKKAYELDPSKASDIAKGLKNASTKLIDDAYTAYSLGDNNRASECFELAFEAAAAEPCKQMDNDALYNAGFTAFLAGNNDRAKALFEKCLANGYAGEDGDAYAKLSAIASNAGDKETAKDYLEQGFAKYPQSQGILVGLINYYITSGDDTNRLFALLDDAKKNEPNNASLYYVEGNAREKLGDIEGAVAAYNKCSEINPEYESGFIGLGVLYYNQAVALQEKASAELDDAKYMAIMSDFEKSLKSCIEPFEKGFELAKSDETKAAIAEYLKNACFRFREESQEYMDKYNKYANL